MKVSGYGEFQQMRKLIQKDEAQEKKGKNSANANDSQVTGDGDAVQISSAARRKGKLYAAPEVRESKIEDIRARMEAGTLVTPESLRRGTTRMLNSLAAGEI